MTRQTSQAGVDTSSILLKDPPSLSRKRQATKASIEKNDKKKPPPNTWKETIANMPTAQELDNTFSGIDGLSDYETATNKSKAKKLEAKGEQLKPPPVHIADRFTKRLKCKNPPKGTDYLEIGFSDLVWFLEHEGTNELKLGRLLNCFHKVGPPVTYHVLPKSGLPVSRDTLMRMTEHEENAEINREMIEIFDSALAAGFNRKSKK